jgi:hypothetical protein
MGFALIKVKYDIPIRKLQEVSNNYRNRYPFKRLGVEGGRGWKGKY